MPKNPLELQEIMTALVVGRDNTDLVHSFKSRKITIETDEKVPWTLDGEFGGSHTAVEIEEYAQGAESLSEKHEKQMTENKP